MSNTLQNNFKLGGNPTELHSTGLSPGSVPSLAFLLSISSIFFSARSMCVCLVVIEFVMLCTFSGLVGWLCQLPFLFPRVPSMSNTPRIISNLGVISWNGIPLGSLLEVFPALHFSFLFLPFSFSKKHVCMLVVTGFAVFVHFLGWLGCCAKWHSTGLFSASVPSLTFFLSISSIFFSARSMCVCLVVTGFVMFCAFSGLVGWLCQLPFLFPGVQSMSNTPQNNFKLGGNPTELHSTGLSPGSVPSFAFFLSISSIFSSARSMCVCLVVTGFVKLSMFFLGWLGGCAKWHSTGLSPGSIPSLAFFLSTASIFFSARSMYLCFVGCGLWDSAWQMANLPDRSKCINYRKILWFWNVMIYLH